ITVTYEIPRQARDDDRGGSIIRNLANRQNRVPGFGRTAGATAANAPGRTGRPGLPSGIMHCLAVARRSSAGRVRRSRRCARDVEEEPSVRGSRGAGRQRHWLTGMLIIAAMVVLLPLAAAAAQPAGGPGTQIVGGRQTKPGK